MKRFLQIGILTASLCSVAYGAEVATLIKASLLGGQNTYESETNSTFGNVNLNIVPAIKFSDKLSLIPSGSFEYRQIKEAKELADGNILFQKGLNYNLSIKPIIVLKDDMSLKIKAGYMMQQLQEADNETLDNGAFNYSKMTAGVELAGKDYSFGYNYYAIAFPNYKSLLENNTTAQAQVGSGLGSTGLDILDFSAHEIYVFRKYALSPRVVFDATVDYTRKYFKDQTVAQNLTAYSSDKRSDDSFLVNVFPSFALVPTGPITMYGGINLTAILYDSTQNYADVSQGVFTNFYYDYTEYKLMPMLNFSFNTIPLKVDLSYEYSMRKYSSRLAQAKSGLYKAEKATLDTSYLSLGVSYPIFEGFNIFTSISDLTSSSNIDFDSSYKYNYKSNSYFLGISYEYQ